MMTFAEAASFLAERLPVPDALIRAGISGLVQRTDRSLGAAGSGAAGSDAAGSGAAGTDAAGPVATGLDAASRGTGPEMAFARDMDNFPIAIHTDAANAQHYELPSGFFELVLGPRLKYSSCYFEDGESELDIAEENALARTAVNAGIANGQDILELGCGWGSLSLYMAENFPQAQITAVSNSHSQRGYVESLAGMRGLTNLKVITCDMNDFATDQVYDRVVSVEMFEHMSNWRALLTAVKSWLKPNGRAFIHVFTHNAAPYRFDAADKEDWIAQHFFTGGIMPSHGLIRCFPDLFNVEAEWRWSGNHYARTACAWLANFDRNIDAIMPLLRATYGADAQLWKRRWRMFFLATEGLFGHASGESWGISQYRLRSAGRGSADRGPAEHVPYAANLRVD